MTIGQNASAAKAVLLAAAVLATPAQAWAGPADTYYERAFVVAADARCGLFDDRVDAELRSVLQPVATQALSDLRRGDTDVLPTSYAVVLQSGG
ncbi:MAG: hypothetical protein QME55_07680, partial [Brevundimonas sp.]|nr:hypothetical protein [Brevundimonas sp.]